MYAALWSNYPSAKQRVRTSCLDTNKGLNRKGKLNIRIKESAEDSFILIFIHSVASQYVVLSSLSVVFCAVPLICHVVINVLLSKLWFENQFAFRIM